MASLREIGQGLGDAGQKVGDELRQTGNRILDADLAPLAQTIGMLLLIGVICALVMIGWYNLKRAIREMGWEPYLKRPTSSSAGSSAQCSSRRCWS